MRKIPIAAATLAVLSVAACQKDRGNADPDLAKDLALAASSDGIAMAPSGAGRSTVSAIEQLPPGVTHTVVSSRGAHSLAKHRTLRAKANAPQVALLPSTTPIPAQTVTLPAPAPVEAPVAITPRPRPVEVSYPSPGPLPGSAPGTDRGGVTPSDWPGGGIGGVILRGGTVDGDHCDPRSDRPRTHISINNRIPPIGRGTF